MKIIRSLILFATLFIGIPSFAMDCTICLEPISANRPILSLCPNEVCSQANPACKECLSQWLEKKQVLCPQGCGSNLKTPPFTLFYNFTPSHTKTILPPRLSSQPLISQNQKMFVLGALSVAVLPWIAHYWSQYCLQSTLRAINNAAQLKTDMLLSFEFDCDADNTAFLTLQESFDINRILPTLNTELRHTTLKAAIEQYDVVLRKVYERIIRVYYYQPIANFEKKEPELVQELKACTEQINQLVMKYSQELGSPLRNIFFGIGVGILSGIGILNIANS